VTTSCDPPTQNHSWFTVEPVAPQTYAISEYGHWEEPHSYLFVGSERAALIDSGLGIGDIRAVVDQLTHLPVIACTTHCHWDHIGGHGSFDEVAVHRLDAGWMEHGIPVPLEARRWELMREAFRLPAPASFAPDRWERFCGQPTIELEDLDVVDLGDRRLTAMHTPGHSPGHLCFYEQALGLLCTGDLFYSGTLYANYESTDPVAFASSIDRIVELQGVRRILPGHHQLDVTRHQLTALHRGLRDLASRGQLRHGTGIHGCGACFILL